MNGRCLCYILSFCLSACNMVQPIIAVMTLYYVRLQLRHSGPVPIELMAADRTAGLLNRQAQTVELTVYGSQALAELQSQLLAAGIPGSVIQLLANP